MLRVRKEEEEEEDEEIEQRRKRGIHGPYLLLDFYLTQILSI